MPYLLTDDEHRGLSALAASLINQASSLALFLARDCQRLQDGPPASQVAGPAPAAPASGPGEPANSPPPEPRGVLGPNLTPPEGGSWP